MDVYVVTFGDSFVVAAASLSLAKIIVEARENRRMDWDHLSDGGALAGGYFIWREQILTGDSLRERLRGYEDEASANVQFLDDLAQSYNDQEGRVG